MEPTEKRIHTSDDLKLFVHAQGAKPKLVTAASGEVLREVLRREALVKDAEHEPFAFVGEWEEARDEVLDTQDGADNHQPSDMNLTVAELDLARHRHIHLHHCRHITVQVHFGGDTKHHKFSPSATVETATIWARKKARLDLAVAGEYVLQICNSKTQPRSDQHLGDLVGGSDCSLCFDLVKEITPAGGADAAS